jgi:hypothetical protein
MGSKTVQAKDYTNDYLRYLASHRANVCSTSQRTTVEATMFLGRLRTSSDARTAYGVC